MKFSELIELSDEELARRLAELEEERFNLRFQRAAGQEGGKPQRMRAIRRDIARIRTAQRQRQLAGRPGKEGGGRGAREAQDPRRHGRQRQDG